MIHPIRPVGETSIAVQYLVMLDGKQGVRAHAARLGRICLSCRCLQLGWVLALLERTDTGQLRALSGVERVAQGEARGVFGDDEALSAVERWAPWPARKPFADEVKRWWPSEELPPIEPPSTPEGLPIRPVPEFPLYPVRGGLFNTWA